ncbi:hypothetical protein PTSG_04880 [Salpingoeca rosetta]|uniref:Uncharacterized protein n=1 Tax=Salpingoeca rosetta (strain ATCC 50818 / BSB-021) TaxID=946362 RepID=F2U8W4_SALR5|nr:uncharacterized protein PTSG_04880 [Salpingoeca rosetta]EGD73167.1 hypothetical protein PTSG_04880 [Salpingoeca rosetta]|eukprot:XP_004994198.1 hypothetical protein PTSG_04880 [Salpingoeca rosetta]
MLFGDDAEPFVDALPLLPSACSDDDVPQLLSRCANMGARTDVQILADTIVTTTEFIDACREKIEALMPERLQGIDLKAAKDAVESAAQGGTNTANDDDEDNGLSGKSKRRGRKKKSGGGASAKGKKGKSAAPSTDILNFMSLDEMSAFITKAFPDTEDHPGLADEIAAKLHAPLSSKFKEMVVARIKSGASGTGRKEARATLERTFSTMYDNIQAFAKTSASLSETDASLSSTLDRHLLRSLCPDLVAVLIKLLALENLIQFDVDKPLSSDERKEILNESAPADKKTFNELLQMCNGKDLAAFQTAMEKVAEDRLQLFIRPFDKKTEKQVLANHRAGLAQMVDALPNTANLGEALLAVITLLFAQQRNECLHAHGRSIPQLLDVLKDDVDEDTFATLKQAQDEVYAQLTKGEDEEPVELTVTVADLKRLVAKK